MGQPSRIARATPHRGFTLVEILVVLVIIAILLSMAGLLTRGISAAQKRSLTATRIAGVDTALVQFVVQSRRLPCPADGRITSGFAKAGEEMLPCDAALDQSHGVVPWVTLGLPEVDATDGWDRRLTYRAHPTLVDANTMDMSSCDPAGTIAGPASVCSATCSASALGNCTPPSVFLAGTVPPGKGFRVQNVVGNALMNPPATGAAYVVVSHGESSGGAYLNSGQLSTTSTIDGWEEQRNYANLPIQPYYVDDSTTDIAGPNHIDDTVSRPSVLSVISKASLGPRSH